MPVRVREVFSSCALTRLDYDEPASASDPVTGIDLHYRFEHAAGGVLRLTGGALDRQVVAIGCDPGQLNLVATILLAGLAAEPR